MNSLISLQLTSCPECGRPAEINRRMILESTDGPIEHSRLRCIAGHWFMMPTGMLATPPEIPTGPAEAPLVRRASASS